MNALGDASDASAPSISSMANSPYHPPPDLYNTFSPVNNAPSIRLSANLPCRPLPDLHYTFSPVNNASGDAFDAGARFCAMYPLGPPLISACSDSLTLVHETGIRMGPESPYKYISIITMEISHPPTTIIRVTKKKCPDTNILSQHPLYLSRYSPFLHKPCGSLWIQSYHRRAPTRWR